VELGDEDQRPMVSGVDVREDRHDLVLQVLERLGVFEGVGDGDVGAEPDRGGLLVASGAG
jgi:hypothetical protein